ncbi:MAG: hypothetical protein JWN36_1825 [Microbacteriaceae bacterium]|nr:hypothetical protein [Microbacteriaceae bacterium]
MAVRLTRWIPAAAAVVVVAAGAIAVPIAANATADLAPKNAEQVLALMGSSKEDTFSGTVTTTTSLGLPSLPSVGGSAGSDSSGLSSILSMLSTPQNVRVYVDGPTKQRVQVLTNMAEQDVIHNGTDVWAWDSKKQTVEHTTLASRTETPKPTATHSPADIAHQLVTKLKGSTNLSVGTTVKIDGRDTYTLVLTPKVSDTLVKNVSISVDAQSGLPLAVTANARGQKDPAVSVAFSKIDLSTPAASLFDFTAPKGAKVTEHVAPSHQSVKSRPGPVSPDIDKNKPTVVGTGWDAVVVTPANAQLVAGLGSASVAKQLGALTTAVPEGRVFHTSLVNVLLTTDGRVIAGSVSVDRLEAVASTK